LEETQEGGGKGIPFFRLFDHGTTVKGRRRKKADAIWKKKGKGFLDWGEGGGKGKGRRRDNSGKEDTVFRPPEGSGEEKKGKGGEKRNPRS